MSITNSHPHRTRLVAALIVAAVFAGCSSGGGASGATDTPAGEVTTVSVTDPSPSAPVETVDTTEPAATEPVATAEPDATVAETAPATLDELDDLDEDGAFDERCGTADLGGGLVVQTLCSAELVPAPEGGVTPLPNSLLTLPTPLRWDDLADVDAVLKVATRPDGSRVAIYVLGSDTLFDSGSAAVRTTAQPPLAAIVASIAARFPGKAISVRGAADSVGDTAANQSLSEQRAAAIAAQLIALGVPAATVTSLGLGETVPVAAETNPDGSVSEIGRQVNRRVEIVVG